MLTYVVHGPGPAQVTIELVRELDGLVLLHWDAPQVAPEAIQRLAWDGRVAGHVQLDGRYGFRVTGDGLVAAVASFELARERFPILGKFSFGSGSASFGGGRGHQGQDVFAECGTPLVAAHGGTVKFSGYHGRAGNYLVIDNEDDGADYVVHAPARQAAGGQGRPRPHGSTDRLRGLDRRGERVPPALRELDRPGLVLRRPARSTRCRSLRSWAGRARP